MRGRDAVWVSTLRRRGIRPLLLTLLGAALLGAGANADSRRPVKLKRCGYTTATYGRSALYPWHMSCPAARKVVRASDNPHDKVINFGPGWDGAAVPINGHYWVCTGLTGSYNCGYPYRPRKLHGSQGYEVHSAKTWYMTRALCARASAVRRRPSPRSPGLTARSGDRCCPPTVSREPSYSAEKSQAVRGTSL